MFVHENGKCLFSLRRRLIDQSGDKEFFASDWSIKYYSTS